MSVQQLLERKWGNLIVLLTKAQKSKDEVETDNVHKNKLTRFMPNKSSKKKKVISFKEMNFELTIKLNEAKKKKKAGQKRGKASIHQQRQV